MTVDTLRTFAVARSLFPPTSLSRTVERLGFVQADPIRAPARAQDLILRHRVAGYRNGDLDRRYTALNIEEDVFINYGFVSQAVSALMHPRGRMPAFATPRTRPHKLLAFVRERGEAHPRQVDAHFAHGTVTNYWGGSSSATTRLLEEMHFRGWLRVVRREKGIRVYAARTPAATVADDEVAAADRIDALIDVAVNIYAPLPALSLTNVVARLAYAVPHLRGHLKAGLTRARRRLARERIDGVDWFWPAAEQAQPAAAADIVRLLAPFDPVVWDRRRFELFWGWPYRFEAYTPIAKRRFGYYALPMLWRDRVIGWANLTVAEGALQADVGFVAARAPRERAFAAALDQELARVRAFLGLR